MNRDLPRRCPVNPFVRTTLIKRKDLTQEENLMYEKAHERLKLLGKNQLNIYGVHFSETRDQFIVKAIIRSTIEKPVHFKRDVPIALFDDQGQFIIKEDFNLSNIHPLQPNSAYPYTFFFSKDNLLKEDYTLNESWLIVFKQGKKKNKLDLSDSPISRKAEGQLQKLLDKLGSPKEGEINIVGLSIQKVPTGDIQATVLVRNGTREPIDIQKLPMQIVTPKQEIVAQGTFSLKGLIVKPYTSKPASFVFPRNSILLRNIDLSTCKIQTVT